jgi:hypothetical protein
MTPKEKRAPAKSALQKPALRTYKPDERAQDQFRREFFRLLHEFGRTGNYKHLRACERHLAGMQDWGGKYACLERVYAETGHSKAAVIYTLTQVEHIGEQAGERKGKAHKSGSKKGGAQ